MATRIQDIDGNVIGHSKNLRGVLRRASKFTVDAVWCCHAKPFAHGELPYYDVQFEFSDGSIAFTEWADWRVLVDWIKARRSWRISKIAGELEFKQALAPFLASQSQ